jgi:hypothetical protein
MRSSAQIRGGGGREEETPTMRKFVCKQGRWNKSRGKEQSLRIGSGNSACFEKSARNLSTFFKIQTETNLIVDSLRPQNLPSITSEETRPESQNRKSHITSNSESKPRFNSEFNG